MLRGRANGRAGCFYYPRRGFGQIVEALADAATAAGAEIRLGAEVQRIDASQMRCPGRHRAGDLLGSQVFSTLPLPMLARITRQPARRNQATGRLRAERWCWCT
jgi:phytoene dehydrogenase-like protein